MDRSRHQLACPGCRGSGRKDCQQCDGMGTMQNLPPSSGAGWCPGSTEYTWTPTGADFVGPSSADQWLGKTHPFTTGQV